MRWRAVEDSGSLAVSSAVPSKVVMGMDLWTKDISYTALMDFTTRWLGECSTLGTERKGS